MTRRLLVVDWDYFFPVPRLGATPDWWLYDWGHQENVLGKGPLWFSRGAAFIQAGQELPGLSGEQESFWSRFSFAPGARLYIADSNTYAVDERVWQNKLPQQVWLYDAHHDSGYNMGREQYERSPGLWLSEATYSCENWMVFYGAWAGAKLKVRYPRWKHWAEELEPQPWLPVDRRIDPGDQPKTFHDVVLCRSAAWVPPWLDEDFLNFAAACPVRGGRVWLDMEAGMPRSWDIQDYRKRAWELTEMLLEERRG